MSKNICVIGTGYVGLIAAIGLAEFGNQVTGVDLDQSKIDLLNKGRSPIYEPGIETYLNRNFQSGRLKFSTNVVEGILNADIVFIAVGTPETENGEPDLTALNSVVEEISRNLNSYKVIVVKSTVPIGTNRTIHNLLRMQHSETLFDVVSNPEFLREGSSIQDFFHPDRMIVGCRTEKAKSLMFEVFRPLNVMSVPFVWCDWETAELIKYSANAFLALKVTYINQIANICEAIGADVHDVARALGMDGRISPKFFHPGPGFGGSCFPKDTKALVQIAKDINEPISLIETVIKANSVQKTRCISRLIQTGVSFENSTVAVLGIAFKQQTDDLRESPAVEIIEKLQSLGATVQLHDPQAMEGYKKVNKVASFFETSLEACEGADVVIIATEWNEYRNLPLEKLKNIMNGDILYDTRNVLEPELARSFGFKYFSSGRGLF
ncbi:MAG: UDP-glucose/GDP-mannose dehydrogenase family protein [Spirochaetales bacterium]|nr:UDP-glucose/GDP-mannose dehydrogenase family protein [Spirochaetales bacterium]